MFFERCVSIYYRENCLRIKVRIGICFFGDNWEQEIHCNNPLDLFPTGCFLFQPGLQMIDHALVKGFFQQIVVPFAFEEQGGVVALGLVAVKQVVTQGGDAFPRGDLAEGIVDNFGSRYVVPDSQFVHQPVNVGAGAGLAEGGESVQAAGAVIDCHQNISVILSS